MTKIIHYIFLFIILSFLSSCHHDDTSHTNELDRTIIIYMGADNNLNAEAHQKIEQISSGWEMNSSNKLLIYIDTPYGDGPQLLEITGEDNKDYKILKQYPPVNSADYKIFHSVIKEITNTYPSQSYGLVIFSHASGWLPARTYDFSRSIIVDKNDEMELDDFAKAIPDNLFDFIVFEACNMAGIEVAYELKNKAHYILASVAPILSPGFTYIYKDNVTYFFDSPEIGLKKFAENYMNYFQANSGIFRSATISLIKTQELDDLASTIKNICKSTDKKSSIEDLQTYDDSLEEPFYFFDFEQYYSTLASNELKVQLTENLSRSIIFKAATDNYSVNGGTIPIHSYSGLSTYIEQKQYQELNSSYSKLQWYKVIHNE